MIIHKVAHFAVAAALVTAVGLSFPATAESRSQTTDPIVFIQKLADQAINVLSTQNGSLKDREDRFRDLLRDDFAMDKISRFVVGGYWRKMSDKQRDTYQKLFSEWVLKTYSVRLGGYSGEQFKVIKKSAAGKRDVIVHTRIEQTAGNAFKRELAGPEAWRALQDHRHLCRRRQHGGHAAFRVRDDPAQTRHRRIDQPIAEPARKTLDRVLDAPSFTRIDVSRGRHLAGRCFTGNSAALKRSAREDSCSRQRLSD